MRTSRDGDWDVHMSVIFALILWCFAYDKVNYARHLALYYANRSTISNEYPEVHKSSMKGQYSVQLDSDNL